MASITKSEHKSYGMGLHDEVLTGRTQQTFFNSEEEENFFYHDAYDVDFNKTNTGVWSMSMADFKGKAGYTKWDQYKQDEPITEDKIWPTPVKQKA